MRTGADRDNIQRYIGLMLAALLTLATGGCVGLVAIPVIGAAGSVGADTIGDAPISRALERHHARQGVGACTTPALVPDAAVNLIILPFAYEETQIGEISLHDWLFEEDEDGNKVRFDVFYTENDLIPQVIQADFMVAPAQEAFAVTRLIGNQAECTIENVVKRIMNGSKTLGLQPGKALVLLRAGVYEHEGTAYLQSEVHFLRKGPADSGEIIEEDLAVVVDSPAGSLVKFIGHIPSQRVLLEPREVAVDQFVRLRAMVPEVVDLRKAPDGSAGSVDFRWHVAWVPRDFKPEQFQVAGTGMAGWNEISRTNVLGKTAPSTLGWIQELEQRGNAELLEEWNIRELMPELYFVDALIAYLGFRVTESQYGHDHLVSFDQEGKITLLDTLLRFDALLYQFERGYHRQTLGSDRIPLSVFQSLSGILWFRYSLLEDTLGRNAQEARSQFDRAVDNDPGISDLVNLSAVGKIYDCCVTGSVDEAPQDIINQLVLAYVLDTSNLDVMENIASFYKYLLQNYERLSRRHPEMSDLTPDILMKNLKTMESLLENRGL